MLQEQQCLVLSDAVASRGRPPLRFCSGHSLVPQELAVPEQERELGQEPLEQVGLSDEGQNPDELTVLMAMVQLEGLSEARRKVQTAHQRMRIAPCLLDVRDPGPLFHC